VKCLNVDISVSLSSLGKNYKSARANEVHSHVLRSTFELPQEQDQGLSAPC